MTAPSLTGFSPTITFLENTAQASPQFLDTSVVFTDPDNDYTGGKLTLSGLVSGDVVAIHSVGNGAGQLGYASGVLSYGGVAIGMVAGGAGSTLTVTFNASATSTAIDALIENLTYQTTSDASAASRSLYLNVVDAGGHDLGFAPQMASFADMGVNSPFFGIDPGRSVLPFVSDWNNDGVLNAFIMNGTADGGPKYYNMTGGHFVQVAPASAPTQLAAVSGPTGIAALNISGGPEQELIVSKYDGTFHIFAYNGSQFVENTTDNSTLLLNADGGTLPTLAFGDVDGDGDKDMVVGNFAGTLKYFENARQTPTGQNLWVDADFGLINPFAGIDAGSTSHDRSAPALVDLDGDGDQDLVVGREDGQLRTWRNDFGTFNELTGGANPFNGFSAPGRYSNPTFADVDGDGDFDAIIGANSGPITVLENTTPHGQQTIVSVTSQNDAPTGAPVDRTIDEDQPYTFLLTDFTAGFSDSDNNSFAGVQIASLASAGSLTLDGVAVSLDQLVSAADIVAGKLSFAPGLNANGADYASFGFKIQDSGGTANGGADISTAAYSFGFDVDAVGDAPTSADASRAIGEDGSYTFTLADFSFGDAADAPSADTFAFVQIMSLASDGVLMFDADGLGAGDPAAVRLLEFISTDDIDDGRLFFVPTADENDATDYAHFNFRVEDDGGVGNGGQYLSTQHVFTIDVGAVNDAPLVSGATASLSSVAEDAADPAGASVSTLFASHFDDSLDDQGGSSANGFAGVSITANGSDARGVWQYRDGPGAWTAVGAVTDSAALVLSATAELRFLSAADFNGAAPSLVAHLIDDSAGAVTTGDTADAGANGASTAISTGTVTLGTSIDAVNDAPVISAPANLTADVNLAKALTGLSFSDIDAGNNAVTVTLDVTNGTLVSTGDISVGVTGSGGNHLVLTGSVAGLSAFFALGGATFVSDDDANDAVLTVAIDDSGATGGGALTDEATVAISVRDFRMGTAADETITGAAKDSRLQGLAGDDLLDGAGGADLLLGGGGNDTLVGGSGADTLNGGGGSRDVASFAGAASSVTASIAGASATGAATGADVLSGVEGLLGSDQADDLSGDGGKNTLDGGAGDDVLHGDAGADRLSGGAGFDTVDYSAGGLLLVDLVDVNSSGFADDDIYKSIEGYRLSQFADIFLGGHKAAKVEGLDGSDSLVGGAGRDSLEGGDGADILVGGGGADVLTGAAGADVFKYLLETDSPTHSVRDTVADFSHAGGDRIDLSALAAADFVYLGSAAFHGTGAAEIRLKTVGADQVVLVDIDGDKTADIEILVQHGGIVGAADFVL